MSGIVFDLDGTLIDSAPDIHAGIAQAFQAEGLEPLSLEQVRSFIGAGVDVLVTRCLKAVGRGGDRDLHSRVATGFRALYAGQVHHTRLYPGAREALRALHADGFRLGLCTNKPEDATRVVLRHFDILELFDAFAFGDGDLARKPDPAPLRHVIDQMEAARFLYVGDSETDAETARNAGVGFALFTGGYRAAPPEDIPHDARFDDFAELRGIVDRLCPRPE